MLIVCHKNTTSLNFGFILLTPDALTKTAKNAQAATSRVEILQLVMNKPISGCVRMSTDLLQVDRQNLLSTGLPQVVSTSCNKSANDKLQQA